MNRRVLLVDDEPRVLDGYRRTLRKSFEVLTAVSAKEGLAVLTKSGPVAAVVSDYRMPETNGVQFLTEVRRSHPDVVRLMLTGQADFGAVIAAINEGDVFRFLTKPCPAQTLSGALDAAIEQHRLVIAERELLEETLRGTVEVLIDVLGLVDPATHRESAALRDRVRSISSHLELPDPWEFEVAALVSQLGTIAFPSDALHRLRSGRTLSDTDRQLLDQHPQSAYHLLGKIPRLGRVARMVLAQLNPPGTRPMRPDDPDDDDRVAMGAHLLNVALTVERSTANRRSLQSVVDELRRGAGPPFRQAVIDALEEATTDTNLVRAALSVAELRRGMTLAHDVYAVGGLLLLAEGQILTEAHLQRLHRFRSTTGVEEPIAVLVPEPSGD